MLVLSTFIMQPPENVHFGARGFSQHNVSCRMMILMKIAISMVELEGSL